MASFAWRCCLPLVALAWLSAAAPGAAAQSFIKPGEETFTLNLGGIVNQFDTSLRLDGDSTRGTPINLESNGLGRTRSSFVADATWRITPRNRVDLQYFSTTRSGSRDYSREVTIGGSTFPTGATVGIDAKDQFLLGNYRYSFVKTDEVELAGLLGIYGGRFEFNVNATGHELPDPQTYQSTASTTVPLPLIGGTLDWYINPRWKVSAGVSGLKASIGDVDGTAIVAAASTDYMLTRNLGLGLRYMYSDVDVDVSRSNFHGNATWRMNSVSVYAKVMF
jgi:hypothetical protein